MALELRSKDIRQLLDEAYARGTTDGDQLEQRLQDWTRTLRELQTMDRITYLPVLCVCLVARSASDSVDVRRIRAGDDYSAALVGTNLVAFADENEIDVRTSSTNVMNSQPFIRQPEITSDLSDDPSYPVFFQAVQQAQDMTSAEAKDVLALAMHLGSQAWPDRKRRVQRNQAQPAAPQLLPLEPDPVYFILNQSPHQDFQHYDTEDYYGFHANVTSAKALVTAGGGQFVFYRTSDAKDFPMSFVGAGRITEVQDSGVDDEGRDTWRAHIVDYTPFASPVAKSAGAPKGWNSQNSIARIGEADFSLIVRLGTGGATEVEPLTVAALSAACADRGLLLDDVVLAALVAALDSGKHVILTGPPGTAKTTLAVLVSRLATLAGHCAGYTLTTATADWSTYDTVGGLAPQPNGTLAFGYGLFLQALEDNRWLVVDELNRSNFDRAFGPLFTVLAGEDVVLQYQHRGDGRTIRLLHESHLADGSYHDVLVRDRWRMVATINNFDKSLLFEMSFALMRRFAFVEVPAPSDSCYLQLVDRLLDGDADDVAASVREVVASLLPLRSVKEIGPAIYLDAARMARSMLTGSALTPKAVTLQVFYALLLPQFEGVAEDQGQRLHRTLRTAVGPGQAGHARAMLREVLGLDLGQESGLDEGDTLFEPADGSDEES